MAKKVHEVIAILESNGWQQVRQRGSHRQLKHPGKHLVITIAGKRSATMPGGLLTKIRRQSGIQELR